MNLPDLRNKIQVISACLDSINESTSEAILRERVRMMKKHMALIREEFRQADVKEHNAHLGGRESA